MLQPSGLAGIKMRLSIEISKRLMVCVNSAPMLMEVLSLLHTGLINSKQFMVSDMIPGLSRGKFLTIESSWLFILQQLSPYSHITGISSQINPEGLGVVW